MELTLYYAPTTCALVPYVNLTEAGAPFEVRRINMRNGDNRTPDYLAINPLHKVPALIVDGKVLTENVAIQIWIARTFPMAGLLPADPWQELKAISFMSFCSSDIHPHLSRFNGPRKYCDVPGTEDAVRGRAAEHIAENLHVAENLLDGRDYFFEQFTAADTYFFWCFRRATEFQLDLAPFPHCRAHFDRMQARPSVARVLAFEKEVKAGFAA